MQAYELFGAFVCADRDWQDYNGDFCDACRDAGIIGGCDGDFIMADLDELLVGELGMSGQTVLDALRNENGRPLDNHTA